ncbi:hypothetical protein VMCG_10543 [Cytospora schulzeri]|uniref:ABM domain-containing protein n=1 Tax=Cytospora schulzeri TaxID=448051 RepID=A0A423VAE4_9PEZI|nr:hypothetical protein VMCG_10543 [Valsa malicola]
MTSKGAYYSVSTLTVKSENIDKHYNFKIVEFFTRVAKATEELEPAAEIYRWYKGEGKDEFGFIEK